MSAKLLTKINVSMEEILLTNAEMLSRLETALEKEYNEKCRLLTQQFGNAEIREKLRDELKEMAQLARICKSMRTTQSSMYV